MKDTGLDEISESFVLIDYNNIMIEISKIHENYIKSRIKLLWKLPLIVRFTTTKVKFMYSEPRIIMDNTFDDDKIHIDLKQKVMLVGVTEFWAHRLLIRRK